jgi:hypothetical protein
MLHLASWPLIHLYFVSANQSRPPERIGLASRFHGPRLPVWAMSLDAICERMLNGNRLRASARGRHLIRVLAPSSLIGAWNSRAPLRFRLLTRRNAGRPHCRAPRRSRREPSEPDSVSSKERRSSGVMTRPTSSPNSAPTPTDVGACVSWPRFSVLHRSLVIRLRLIVGELGAPVGVVAHFTSFGIDLN